MLKRHRSYSFMIGFKIALRGSFATFTVIIVGCLPNFGQSYRQTILRVAVTIV